MMNKKELTEKVYDEAAVTLDLQYRPYTLVCVEYYHDADQRPCIGAGFAKCCYPDKWDEVYGINLAHKKAVAHVVRQVLGKEEKYQCRFVNTATKK